MQDFQNKEETYAVRHAMGTGPFQLVSAEPDVKRVLKKNPNWWGIKEGRFEGNVDEIVYRPIRNAGTREAALLSGEIDFILKIVSKDLQSFQEFLTSKLTPAPNVASVKTSLTIRTAKNEPGVPLD